MTLDARLREWLNTTLEVDVANNEKAIQVRVPVATYDWLKERASAQDRSLNWTLGRLIHEARERDEQKEAA